MGLRRVKLLFRHVVEPLVERAVGDNQNVSKVTVARAVNEAIGGTKNWLVEEARRWTNRSCIFAMPRGDGDARCESDPKCTNVIRAERYTHRIDWRTPAADRLIRGRATALLRDLGVSW